MCAVDGDLDIRWTTKRQDVLMTDPAEFRFTWSVLVQVNREVRVVVRFTMKPRWNSGQELSSDSRRAESDSKLRAMQVVQMMQIY